MVMGDWEHTPISRPTLVPANSIESFDRYHNSYLTFTICISSKTDTRSASSYSKLFDVHLLSGRVHAIIPHNVTYHMTYLYRRFPS